MDYGAGNLRSVARALEQAGAQALVTARGGDLAAANGVVLPGVAAAADTMRGLTQRGLVEPLLRAIESGVPFLGLCMGLQALLTSSEEGGQQACLDVIPGIVHKLPAGLKVPQMGWNQVTLHAEHPLLNGISDGSYFYFVHSFYAEPRDLSVVLGTTEYGLRFASILARDNVFATQFHPEKSGATGLRLYRNFVDQCRR